MQIAERALTVKCPVRVWSFVPPKQCGRLRDHAGQCDAESGEFVAALLAHSQRVTKPLRDAEPESERWPDDVPRVYRDERPMMPLEHAHRWGSELGRVRDQLAAVISERDHLKAVLDEGYAHRDALEGHLQ